MPLVRFRQITAAIQSRKYLAQREENARASWMTRNIAGFIAMGYMVEKGKENPGIKMASELAYDDVEAKLMGVELSGGGGQKENGNGSYERFMRMAGQLEQRGKMI